jgi:5'-deoxynucleotidase YfbR-like HD superfamily hydrolase
MSQEPLSKEYILSEVRKLQYLYGLKTEIRYGQERPEDLYTESVAEHIYGMHICAQYFLPLEDPENKLDRARVYELITLHDVDEIETGDIIGYLKTDEMRSKEIIAAKKVIEKSPLHMQKRLSEALEEYNEQTTPEAKFVKAIDRFEPLIQIYNKFGKTIVQKNKTREEDSRRIKESYIKPYPTMLAYNQVVHQAMIDEGYFWQ